MHRWQAWVLQVTEIDSLIGETAMWQEAGGGKDGTAMAASASQQVQAEPVKEFTNSAMQTEEAESTTRNEELRAKHSQGEALRYCDCSLPEPYGTF